MSNNSPNDINKPMIIGLIGLGVMGRNLALNLLDHQVSLSAYSYNAEERDAFTENNSQADVADSLSEFVTGLDSPRIILLMVTAGEAVDSVISDLTPFLSAGDILIDGGNSHYKDTMRREAMLKEKSLNYIGTGISGGEEGARHGASLMPGGSSEAFSMTESIFAALSTKANGEPCFGHMGANGAGHFVKMVHNGIEYGVMQLIAESYHFLKHQLGHSNPEIGGIYANWNQAKLRSYLMEITADIFTTQDGETEGFLIEVISDRAGQKGTGRWTVDAAMELGVPVPGIAAAVTERQISGLTAVREQAAESPIGRQVTANPEPWHNKLENTLYASILTMYIQGLSLIEVASQNYGWHTDLTRVIKLWRGGCIIRAALLETLIIAVSEKNAQEHLILTETLQQEILPSVASWREVVGAGVASALSLPSMSASLNYLTSLHTAHLPTNLIQAQRDYFGAHTYQRTDKPGTFHTDWVKGE
ncbi:MAG: NADP-dependent phosphogluconate dehydrogenase, partial [Pseudomonadota bacterium]